MITRPRHLNAYEFVKVASLRAQQLLAGCTPRLAGDHSPATMAQMEVAGGLVRNVAGDGDGPEESAGRVEESHPLPPVENPV
jgi:DNA-directed RNA polymerase subunit K/omega